MVRAGRSAKFRAPRPCPPFRPQPRLGEMLPDCRTWGGDIELDDGCGGLAGHLVHPAAFFQLPCLLEVAHPHVISPMTSINSRRSIRPCAAGSMPMARIQR